MVPLFPTTKYRGQAMRLDLPRYNCTAFSVSSEFTVSTEDDAAIQALMMETMNVSPQSDDHVVAVFGSRSTASGVVHQTQGLLARHHEEDKAEYLLMIECEVAPEELTRPPNEIRSVTRLIDVSTEMFGELEIDCNATFIHDLQDENQSRVTLPIPLLLAEQDDPIGMTHIESVRLSRRVEDRVTHSVEIIPSEDSSSVTHIVNYGIKSELSVTMLRHMLKLAGDMSLGLINS